VILTGALTVAIAALFLRRLRRRLSSAQIMMACFIFQGLGITIMGFYHQRCCDCDGCAILGIGPAFRTHDLRPDRRAHFARTAQQGDRPQL